MKHFSLKKTLAVILSVLMVMSFLPFSLAAETTDVVTGEGGKWDNGTEASIIVDGDLVSLKLNFNKGYNNFTGDWTPQLDYLIPLAIDTYNANHDTALVTTDIKKIVVTDVDGVSNRVSAFMTFLTSYGYAAQITELDLSAATFRTITSSDDISKETYKWPNFRIDKFPLLKTLKLGDGLTIVPYQVFKGMTSLEEVVLNDCITKIESNAFEGCTSLKALNLPASLESIGLAVNTVQNCENLSMISYHGNSTDSSLYDRILGYVNLSTVTKIDLSGSSVDVDFALSVLNKANITHLNITDCANIEYESDNGMLLWEKIVALRNNGVEVLAPANADPDKKADTVVGTGNKWDNATEARIIAEEQTTSLYLNFKKGYNNFTGDWTPQLDKLIPLAIDTYNANHSTTLAITDITKIVVTNIDGVSNRVSTFLNFLVDTGYATQLTALDLSQATFRTKTSSEDISKETYTWPVFKKFTSLKVLKLGDGLTKIPYQMFYNLTALEEVTLNECVVEIGAGAFEGCSSLKKLDLPSSLNKLGNNTISGCTALNTISYHGNAEGSEDSTTFYSRLVTILKASTVTNIDLSGSGISTADALSVANKTNLVSLDIRNCANIDWNSETGKSLYNRIKTLVNGGVEVKFTGTTQLDVYTYQNSTSQIIIGENEIELSLYFANNIGSATSETLTTAAVDTYNFNHYDSQIAITDITKVTVVTEEGKYVLSTFKDFLKNIIPQVEIVDMSKADVCASSYYEESKINKYVDSYFGKSGNQTSELTALKKVILSENATYIGAYTFKNCPALEEVVLPKALETEELSEKGYEIFANTNVKTLTVTNATFRKNVFYAATLQNIIFVGGENDVVELSDVTGNSISKLTVYCANAEAYNNGIGANLKTKVSKIVYVGDIADVTVSTDETYEGYLLPVSKTKPFAGWKTISENEIEAIWSVPSNVKGDFTNDGVVDIRDLVRLKKYVANIDTNILNNIECVDLEGDGINSNELAIMHRALLGVESHIEYYERINAVA